MRNERFRNGHRIEVVSQRMMKCRACLITDVIWLGALRRKLKSLSLMERWFVSILKKTVV